MRKSRGIFDCRISVEVEHDWVLKYYNLESLFILTEDKIHRGLFLPPSKSLFTIYIWLRKLRVTHFSPSPHRSPVPSYRDKCLKMQALYGYFTFFFVQIRLECIPGVYLYLSWPWLYLWVNFHYNSITHQGIELSVPLQRWITVEKWFKPSTLLTLPKKHLKDFPKKKPFQQIRDLSIAANLIFSLFSVNTFTHTAIFRC